MDFCKEHGEPIVYSGFACPACDHVSKVREGLNNDIEELEDQVNDLEQQVWELEKDDAS